MNCCSKDKHGKHAEGVEQKQEAAGAGVKFSWWWCLLLVPVVLGLIFFFKIPFRSLLPWGVFLLCPLMHVFMMKGHGDHDHKEEDSRK